jgi:hypothetical protein
MRRPHTPERDAGSWHVTIGGLSILALISIGGVLQFRGHLIE